MADIRTESTAQVYGQLVVAADSPVLDESAAASPTLSFVPEEGLIQNLLRTRQSAVVNAGSAQNTVVSIQAPKESFSILGESITPSRSPSTLDRNIASVVMAAASSEGSSQVKINVGGITDIQSLLKSEDTVTTNVVVVGSLVATAPAVKIVLDESAKVDLSITLKSKKSEVVFFNNLKRPGLSSNFVYNFYEPDENKVEIQEDQSKDPLLRSSNLRSVPKYVELEWDMVSTTEQLPEALVSSKENAEMRTGLFVSSRGQSSLVGTSTTSRYNKNYEPYMDDGLSRTVHDIHNPDLVANSTSNNAAFPNTVSVLINATNQRSLVDVLPIKAITRK